jgi:hypothetical protein
MSVLIRAGISILDSAQAFNALYGVDSPDIGIDPYADANSFLLPAFTRWHLDRDKRFCNQSLI